LLTAGLKEDHFDVMPALVAGIHVLEHGKTWMAGTQACESTPFFERLCPAMTAKRVL
jgi:hypothetical protein